MKKGTSMQGISRWTKSLSGAFEIPQVSLIGILINSRSDKYILTVNIQIITRECTWKMRLIVVWIRIIQAAPIGKDCQNAKGRCSVFIHFFRINAIIIQLFRVSVKWTVINNSSFLFGKPPPIHKWMVQSNLFSFSGFFVTRSLLESIDLNRLAKMIWKNQFKKLAGNAFIQFSMFCNVKRKSALLNSMIPLKG